MDFVAQKQPTSLQRDPFAFINSLENFVTTSSSSGRHSLFLSPLTAVQYVSSNRNHIATCTKRSGRWLLVEHDCLAVADLNKAVNDCCLFNAFQNHVILVGMQHSGKDERVVYKF